MRIEIENSASELCNKLWRYSSPLGLIVCALSLLVAISRPISAQEDTAPSQVDASQLDVDLQSSANEEQTEQDRARELEISRELSQYRQAIDELQGNRGIYAAELEEAYSGLALLYEEIEDFDSAISTYSDALQISRINTGLYSDQQLPIIRSLIHNHSHLRNWQEADDLQELNYHISTRLYDFADYSYLLAAQDYGNWKLKILRENLLDQNYRSYSRSAENLSNFYDRIIGNLEIQPGFNPENLIQILYGKTETDLVLTRAIASTPYTSFEGTASRYITQSRCRNVRNASGQIVRECVNVQVENPRYRQSQVDAKQFAMNRRSRAVQESIDRLRQIQLGSSELGKFERDQLESQIAEFETQSIMLSRQSRSRRLF